MKHYLVQEDFESLKQDIAEKEQKLAELQPKLGEAAKKSGSFPSNNPEYVAVLDQINGLQRIVDAGKSFLEKTVVLPLEKFDSKKVTEYTLVTAENIENSEEYKYYIHYPNLIDQSKVREGLLASPESPVGQALMGKKAGDTVKVALPNRNLEIKILELEKIIF